MNTEQIFSNLCENAIDFLDKSISELKTDPKYALIHFTSAVELFLKARLLREHWTLIISGQPDFEKFKSGDMRSVSLQEATRRLSKIVGEPISEKAKKAFEKVYYHRNRVVHFYHDAEQQDLNKFKESVAEDLCLGLHYLQSTLSGWGEHFYEYQSTILSTFFRAREIQSFFEMKFFALSEEIKTTRERGVEISNCDRCGFAAKAAYKGSDKLIEDSCLVCGLTHNRVEFECSECGTIHTVSEYNGFQMINCECGFLIEQSDFQDILSDEILQNKDSEPLSNCGECGVQYVVVNHGGQYVCTECIFVSATIGLCNWCNEWQLGFEDAEFSYVSGCSFCEGQIGWVADD